MTKDRLGYNGLVNKGIHKRKPLPVIKDEREDYGRATVTDDKYTMTWLHNERTKPHGFYAKGTMGAGKEPYITRSFGCYDNDPMSPVRHKGYGAPSLFNVTNTSHFTGNIHDLEKDITRPYRH